MFPRIPPESEKWRHNISNDADLPRKQFTLECWGAGLAVAAGYLIVLIAIWWFAAKSHLHGYPITPFWRAVWLGAVTVGKVGVRTVALPVVLWLGLVIWFAYQFVWHRMRPAIISPGWPAPNQAQDARYAPETYNESRAGIYDDGPEPAAPKTVRIEIANGSHQLKYLDLPDLPQVYSYVGAIAENDDLFSVRNAARYQIGRNMFEKQIRDRLLDRGLAYWKTKKDVRLTDNGRDVCRQFATSAGNGHRGSGNGTG